MTNCKSTFLFKFNIKNTDNIPKVIGISQLCEHAQECPQLKYLSGNQLKLFKALQSCNMNAVLEFDWSLLYNSLQTFETLGLITYPETIVSSDQLKEYTIQTLPKRYCNCRLTR